MVVGTDYDVITGSDTVSAAALLLVGGIVTFVVATVGIIGACAMWRPLLIIVSCHTHTHTNTHTHTLTQHNTHSDTRAHIHNTTHTHTHTEGNTKYTHEQPYSLSRGCSLQVSTDYGDMHMYVLLYCACMYVCMYMYNVYTCTYSPIKDVVLYCVQGCAQEIFSGGKLR